MSNLHILVVCHGNICRSPLIAAVLDSELPTALVLSRGLADIVKGKAAKKVRDYARVRHNLDLSQHQARKMTQEDIDWADVIFYMDGGNKKRLACYSNCESKILNIAEFIGEKRIPDPNFIQLGPELEKTLDLAVHAAKIACQGIR